MDFGRVVGLLRLVAHGRRGKSHFVLAPVRFRHGKDLIFHSARQVDYGGPLRSVPALNALVEFHSRVLVVLRAVPGIPGAQSRLAPAVLGSLAGVIVRTQLVDVLAIAVLVTLAVQWLELLVGSVVFGGRLFQLADFAFNISQSPVSFIKGISGFVGSFDGRLGLGIVFYLGRRDG